MSTLPTGTVTYLFTDIEGSAQLWEQDPQTMREAMSRHDVLVETCAEQHAGHVVRPRGEGDSRFVVFARATNAVAAACALQRALRAEPWVTPTPIRVRIALHTGESELRAGDYYGPAINRCARLRGIAHGGQTLLSLATAEQVRDGLPEGASLRPLGAHRLKDLQRPEQVFQLLHPDLPEEFQPLSSVDASPNNLPVQLASFIGRHKEIAELKRVLSTAHLVTLTGAGGVGKTRLAIQVAVEVQEEYLDGVWLVELGGLADPSLVPQAVATVLGVREEAQRPLTETLIDYLRPKHVLMVLDNCEHLVEACAQIAESVLRACPMLRIVATSREVLNVEGEVAWRVPSLTLPDLRQLPSVEKLAEYEAVRLFSERAVEAASTFRVTSKNASAVAKVCHRLDGIPLALELAAARAKVLSVEQIAERLADQFRVLAGGSRRALPRHQTLRATMDWSYDLLTEPERALLRCLGIFAGGFTLEAAEAVWTGNGVAASQLLDVLGHLVDKSLVLVDAQDGQMRYRLLETVRQYAWDKLGEARETEDARGRHLGFFLKLAERAESELSGTDQPAWLDRLEVEHDNLRAALRCAIERGEAEPGFHLASALLHFWLVRGHFEEGRGWLEQLLRTGSAASASLRAKALSEAGLLAINQGDHAAARSLLVQSLGIQRQSGEKRNMSRTLSRLGHLASEQGDYEQAEEFYKESLALARELEAAESVGISLNNLGVIALRQGNLATARAFLEESAAIKQQLRSTQGLALSLNNLGELALREGDYATARALLDRSLTIRRELGDKRGIAYSLATLGLLALRLGDWVAAQAFHAESVRVFRELGDKGGICTELKEFGILAALQGQAEQATWLLAAAEKGREAIGTQLPPVDRLDYDRHVAGVRAELGDALFAKVWAEGRATTLERAVSRALQQPNNT